MYVGARTGGCTSAGSVHHNKPRPPRQLSERQTGGRGWTVQAKQSDSLTEGWQKERSDKREREMLQRSRTWPTDSAGRGNTERERREGKETSGSGWPFLGGGSTSTGRCSDLRLHSFPAGAVRALAQAGRLATWQSFNYGDELLILRDSCIGGATVLP